MPSIKKGKTLYSLIFSGFFVLSACTNFNGLRQPQYDGQPVVKNQAAIQSYQQHSEVIDGEKEYYLRYSFSADILQPSLDYSDSKPVLLETGRYLIGEDLPAGRVSLLGNESVFTSENYVVHVGNMIIRDQTGSIYFENLFHTDYGQQIAQLDFIAGHEIEIIGENSQITAFYSDTFPDDPYVLMELPALIQTTGGTQLRNPIRVLETDQQFDLVAGIYEVGVHMPAGQYQVSHVEVPHHTEMFIFSESTDPRVFELVVNSTQATAVEQAQSDSMFDLTLKSGDKLYLHLVENIRLTLIE